MLLIGLWFLSLLALAIASLYGVVWSIINRHLHPLFLVFLLLFVLASATEIGMLLQLRSSVPAYAAYWKSVEPPRPSLRPIIYVALGDSAAQGIGASTTNKTYVAIIARTIAMKSGRPVAISNLSQSGDRIQDVIQTQMPQLRRLHPDIVTVDIGANDIVDGTSQTRIIQEYGVILQELHGYPVIFANIPDFMWGTQQRDTTVINRAIQDLGGRYGVIIADLHQSSLKRMWGWNQYAPDGFHPSNAGHQTWAESYTPGINKILRTSNY